MGSLHQNKGKRSCRVLSLIDYFSACHYVSVLTKQCQKIAKNDILIAFGIA